MSEVLIVSRTKMRSGVCVGGINLDNNKFVRLHTDRGANLTEDAPYKIGEIWNLELENPWNPRDAPHTEDKMVKSASYNRSVNNLAEFILNLGLQVYEGDLDDTFEGKIQYTSIGKGYISQPYIPSNSVAFWISDEDIFPIKYYDKDVYRYKNKLIPYVGFQKIEPIPRGTLVRLSLANWWAPEDEMVEKRCYLQLSGWYL